MTEYTTAVRKLVIEDWPYGRNTCRATFTVERKNDRERISRVTVNPKTGRESKPKTTTYGRRCAILSDGNGKTYCATISQHGELISILDGTMKTSYETLTKADGNFQIVKALIDNASPMVLSIIHI